MRTARCTAMGLVWLALAACKEDPSPSEGEGEGDGMKVPIATTGGGTDTDMGEDVGAGADICLSAPTVRPGLHRGDLREKDSNNGGACELGGPDVFFDVEVPGRVDVMLGARGGGFEPRIGVRHSDCTASFAERGLLCTHGVPGWIPDVAAGTRLIVSVGIAADDPALKGSDPLPFELEVAFRPILEEGEGCEPASVGRCESGTYCGAESGAATEGTGSATCRPIDADSCSSARPVVIVPGSTLLGIPRDAVHGDVHEHSCTGTRTAERVYRLELDTMPGPDARIEIEAPDLAGLAVRGPGCLPDQEAACADGDTLVLETPPPTFYLFAEIRDDVDAEGTTGGEEAPYELRILFEPG